jgi:hypothetical protein
MSGEVRQITEGTLSDELIEDINKSPYSHNFDSEN